MKTVHLFRLAALATALFLGACVFDNESAPVPGESGLTSPWVGKPLDSLAAGYSLAFNGTSLIVANRHATSPGVAVVDTASGLITAYYPEIVAPEGLAFTADGHLVVTESDHATQGSVSVINLAAKKIQKDVVSFEQDNAIAAADGKVFLFNHATGAVTGFTGNTPGQHVTFDVQVGSNPYDIAIAGGKAYIPRYNSKYLAILDPAQLGGGTRDSIDLSAYKAADSLATVPRMSLVAAQGGYVFVAVQRLNHSYSAADTSLVLVINTTTKAVTTIPLRFKNPIAGHVLNGIWYVTGVSNYDVTGGVEKIDLTARTNLGTVVTALTLGYDLKDFVPTGAHTGYAVYTLGYPPPTYDAVTRVKKVSF